jgi:hypothetical protein
VIASLRAQVRQLEAGQDVVAEADGEDAAQLQLAIDDKNARIDVWVPVTRPSPTLTPMIRSDGVWPGSPTSSRDPSSLLSCARRVGSSCAAWSTRPPQRRRDPRSATRTRRAAPIRCHDPGSNRRPLIPHRHIARDRSGPVGDRPREARHAAPLTSASRRAPLDLLPPAAWTTVHRR